MAIELISKIKQKNSGQFFLVDASDIDIKSGGDGSNYPDTSLENFLNGMSNVFTQIDEPADTKDGDIWIDLDANATYTPMAVTNIKMSKVDNIITTDISFEDNSVTTSTITLNSDGYPETVVTDGVTASLVWEGF